MIDIFEFNALLVILSPFLFLPFMSWWKNQDKLEKCVTASLAVWCVALTFTRHMAVQLFCPFALFAFISACKNRYFKIHKNWYYLLFAYFIWHIISLLWAPDFLEGLYSLRQYTLFVFIPLVFSCIKLNKEKIDGVLVVFARSMMIFTIVSLSMWIYKSYQLNVPLSEWLIISKKIIGGTNVYKIVYSWCNYYHPTYIAVSLCMAQAIYYYRTSTKVNGTSVHYVETLLFVILIGLLIVVTQSRMGLVIWLTINFFGVGYLLRTTKLKYPYYIAAVAIMLVGSYCSYDKIQTFIYDVQRVQNIQTAVYFIKQHPLLGSGIEGIRGEMANHEVAIELGYSKPNANLGNPHHQFIGDLMQTGVVGLLLLTIIMISLAYDAIKSKSWIYGMFWVISFVLMQIEMPFYLHKGVIFFSLFACLLSMQAQQEK
jgi:hypothetical protein